MTPHKHRGKGTWVLDRIFKGVGRIKRTSGTTDLAMFRKLNDMLTDLYMEGRLDVLEAIKTRRLAPLVIYDKRRRGQDLPDVASMVTLRDTVDLWAEAYTATYPDRAKHGANLKSGLNRVLTAAPQAATVHDLPAILFAYRDTCRQKHSTFNHAKAYVQSFLADVVGVNHATYRDVQAIRSYPKSRRRHPVHLTPAEARAVVDQMPRYQAEVWALLITGMNPKEYWGRWDIKADHLAVYGTKREGRYRQVPLVEPIIRPSVKEWRLPEVREALHTVRPDMQLKDCRNICARWMAKAGIIPANIDAYMGWATKTMQGTYQWDELFRDVSEDGLKLRAYLGVEPRKLEVVK